METNLTSQQLTKLLSLLEQKQVTPMRFQAVMESGILADVFSQNANLDDRDSIRASLRLWAGMPEDMRFVTVGGMTFEERLEENGGLLAESEYRVVNLNTRHDLMRKEFGGTFARYEYGGYTESRQLLGKLFRFPQKIKPEDAVRTMQQDGFEPATLEELMAFGTTFPELQEEFWIYALGSVFYWGVERVPALWKGRCLHLCILLDTLDKDRTYRYLGVQKSSSIG